MKTDKSKSGASVITPDFTRDIREADIPRDVLNVLLTDQTTGKNILWMTDGYQHLESTFGIKMGMRDEIKAEAIARPGDKIIRPRVDKSKAEQKERIQKKAEVFTPSWICNNMINEFDAAWFDRKPAPFTTEGSRDEGWKRLPGKVEFPNTPEHTWLDYVKYRCLEMCCGEGPFLVSRYDTTTGEVIPIPDRIGILDRKLRIVTENVGVKPTTWLKHAILALKATLAFEWQGDSLLIARENILYTILEYYKFYCTEKPLGHKKLLELANIISWNVWQMDGLKCVVPMTCNEESPVSHKPKEIMHSLFEDSNSAPRSTKVPPPNHCPGCQAKKPLDGILLHNGLYCNIMDWTHMKPFRFADLIRDNLEKERRKQEEAQQQKREGATSKSPRRRKGARA